MSGAGTASTTGLLPDEQLADLKQKVKEKLNELGVERDIQDLLSAKGKSTLTKPAATVSKEAAIEVLKERGVIEQLVKFLGDVARPTSQTKSDELLKRNKRILHIRLGAAKNVRPYISKPPEEHEQLVLCGELFGQRFRSHPVTPSETPAFDVSFTVEVPGGATASTASLLSHRQQLHLVLLRTYPHDPAVHGGTLAGQTNLETEVLGTGRCDWREALKAPSQAVKLLAKIILGGTWGANGGLVMCTIAVELEEHGVGSAAIEVGTLREKQGAEQASDAAALMRYMEQAKAFLSPEGSAGAGKLVKLLAHAEDCCLLPVCSFVKPLHLGRALSSPGEASQFVRLLEPRLEVEKDVFDGSLGESWSSLHTIVASGLATPEEKAVLLCSLLSGFCLDAWVAVGTHKHAPKDMRLWVLTRDPATHQATFWDPVTGRRHSPGNQAESKPCPFLEIGCVFSHRRLYANCQTKVPMVQTSFAFEDSGAWRDLVVLPQDLPLLPCTRFDLQMHSVDVLALEVTVEAELKRLLREHRASLGLANTSWDDSLAFHLMPQLAAFEHEAVWGNRTGGSQEFEQAIRRFVPPSSVFKGFPQHHRCVAPPRMVRAILREPAAVDILEARAPDAVFALRVRITPYPEHVFSLWLMLASRTQEGAGLPPVTEA